MIAIKEKFSHFSYLQCSHCEKTYPASRVNTYATCDRCEKNMLLSNYEHLSAISTTEIDLKDRSMWRYYPLLPVYDRRNVVSLGEGFTPILILERLGREFGMASLMMKDESLNPTGSFKARGMSVAISKAKELGITRCIVPTAGNAGGAMSAYCAKAGIGAVVVMPDHTPEIFKKECLMYGAELVLEKGLIHDCARRVREINSEGEYFDVSTLKEPYRLEGKKTIGYEIAEQLSWTLPDVILCPTGGGTGIIGMWKAFHEMIDMGWIQPKLPRMIAVQSEKCRPIVETWTGRQPNADAYEGASTIANGLAVPRPFGERMILRTLHESEGTAVAVSDADIVGSMKDVAKKEGILVAPEGAALWAALKKLLAEDLVDQEETVLLLNTGSGYKYLENID